MHSGVQVRQSPSVAHSSQKYAPESIAMFPLNRPPEQPRQSSISDDNGGGLSD